MGLASSWNNDLLYRVGQTIAAECNEKGIDILLGPCVCLARVPHGGRNFESYGEDPVLSGMLAAAFINGVEDNGVGTTIKHFVCNDTDYRRNAVAMQVDQQTLHELYLKAFRIAITHSDPFSLMLAVTRLNNETMDNNRELITDHLKKAWGFNGFVMTDWCGVKGDRAFEAGVDLEMAKPKEFNDTVFQKIQDNQDYLTLLDYKVRRILRFVVYRKEFLESNNFAFLDRRTKRKMAYTASAESMVLLKNQNNLLPLDVNKLTSIAVIGPNADILRTGAGGSSYVCPERRPSPLGKIREACKNKVEVLHAPAIRRERDVLPIDAKQLFTSKQCKTRGVTVSYFNNEHCSGKPVVTKKETNIAFDWGDFSPAHGVYPSTFSARVETWLKPWESGSFIFKLHFKQGARVWFDDDLVLDHWDHEQQFHQAATYSKLRMKQFTHTLQQGSPVHIRIEFFNTSFKAALALGCEKYQEDPWQTALDIAESADVALVFAGMSWYDEGEGADLASIRLPENQDDLIEEVAARNKNTVVVLNNGTPLLINNWNDKVSAILEAWYPGQEGARAIRDILFGKITPGGKLPVTFFETWNDHPASRSYPADEALDTDDTTEDVDAFVDLHGTDSPVLEYTEGIFMGYRHADKYGVKPLYAFGHGLSYTTFALSDMTLEPKDINSETPLRLHIAITNTGSRAGSEVVQVYFGKKDSAVNRPVKQLVAFNKVSLSSGKTQRIAFSIAVDELAYYDTDTMNWKVETGEYQLYIGTSSECIHQQLSFNVQRSHPAG